MTRKLKKPSYLRTGDKVRVIAPSSPFNAKLFLKGVGKLSSMGLQVTFRKDIFDKKGYLAGSDSRRLRELHEAFADKECRAIFCARGGFGSSRLLNRINFGLIGKNPKVFMGFSDITAFCLSFYSRSKLTSFHGPMIASEPFIRQSKAYDRALVDALFRKKNISVKGTGSSTIIAGKASGKLLGGNLSMIHTMIGTGYLPDFKGSILFVEDIAEAPYRIDRMLSHMFNIDLFRNIRGVVFGRFTDAKGKPMRKHAKELKDLIKDYFSDLKIPVLFNFPISHGRYNSVLPIGVRASIDSRKREIICEAGVSGKRQ